MNVGGETIQISLGPAANAVTSHLCNLQGLAATSSNNDDYYYTPDNGNAPTPLCDPYITHAVDKETYVPRVLFVDGRNCFEPWPDLTSAAPSSIGSGANAGNATATVSASNGVGAWRGNVEVHHRTPSHLNSGVNDTGGQKQGTGVTSGSMNSNDNEELYSYPFVNTSTSQHMSSLDNYDAFRQFQTSATRLYSSNNGSGSSNVNSRYNASRYTHVSSQYIQSSSNFNSDASGRCMVWDDNEEEEEEEDDYTRERRLNAKKQRWNRHEVDAQHDMTHAWDTFIGGASGGASGEQKQTEEGKTEKKRKSSQDTNSILQSMQWVNYFMPPHPKSDMYAAELPFDITQASGHSLSGSSNNQSKTTATSPMLYSYYGGMHPSSFCSTNGTNEASGLSSAWREDVLSERIRRYMEDCDSVRGFHVSVDADLSMFGGLATSVLQELKDECKSAASLVVMVHDGDGDDFQVSQSAENAEDAEEKAQGGRYWRSENKAVQAFRNDLNSGLALHGITEHSDLALPLSLSNCWQSLHGIEAKSGKKNLFEASAAAALALEAVTLPYRIAKGSGSSSSTKNRRCRIGVQSGYFKGSGGGDDDDFPYPTADKLSFHEFISSLKPSNRHVVTELSGHLKQPKLSPLELHHRLMQGTSIERRQLEEERNRNGNRGGSGYYRRGRAQDIDPGLWAEDQSAGGIMMPLSPMDTVNASNSSRSLHQHFCLSTAFRPLGSRVGDVVSTYNSALMEGMGIRYRPQTSIVTVAAHSFDNLTGSGSGYWGSILNENNSKILDKGAAAATGPVKKTPAQILALLGNTTRIHYHLKTTAGGLKIALSRKYAGYLSRDNMSDLAPESEDCTDAMEACLSLRDVYESSMNFSDDEDEGVYFDDNVE